MTAEPRRTLRSHSAAEPQLNEVGFEEPAVWSQELSFERRRQVDLSRGRTGMFIPVSCGGSCAPENLGWEQNGVMYQIQIALKSSTTEKAHPGR